MLHSSVHLAAWFWLASLGIACLRLAVSDLRIREFSPIDTIWINGLAIIGLVVPRIPHPVPVVPALLAGLGATIVASIFYQLGLLGGGDVKLVFAIVALLTRFGSTAWLVYLGALIVAGSLILIAGLRTESEKSSWPLGPVLLPGLPLAVCAVALTQG